MASVHIVQVPEALITVGSHQGMGFACLMCKHIKKLSYPSANSDMKKRFVSGQPKYVDFSKQYIYSCQDFFIPSFHSGKLKPQS